MSEQFQKLLQTTDLQIILFNCYEILKGNAGTISLPDLQLEYFIMVGRNLSRIADSYKFDSLAMFLENCPDIKVVYDSETKEIYATIIDGDMTLSSFRNITRVQNYARAPESSAETDSPKFSDTSPLLLNDIDRVSNRPYSGRSLSSSSTSLESLKLPRRIVMAAPINVRKPNSRKLKFMNEQTEPQYPAMFDKESQTEFPSKSPNEEKIDECISPNVQGFSNFHANNNRQTYKATIHYRDALPAPLFFKPQVVTGYTLNGQNAVMLPLYFGNIWELVEHLQKIEMLLATNRQHLEFYLHMETNRLKQAFTNFQFKV